MNELQQQREELIDAFMYVDRDAFPGTKAWKNLQQVEDALNAFDGEHPEVLADIKANHSKRVERDNPTGYQN